MCLIGITWSNSRYSSFLEQLSTALSYSLLMVRYFLNYLIKSMSLILRHMIPAKTR